MKKGRFIVLEGIDGSGSSTQAKKLVSYLFDKEGYHIVGTKQPSEREIKIKPRLRADMAAGIDPAKEKGEEYVQLYLADRKQHLEEVVIPNLNKGLHVICDRYKYSTFAYQTAQGQDMDRLIEMHEGLIIPDLVLILDLPAEEALRRRVGDKTTPELFERLEFQKAVRKNYLVLKDKLIGENIVVVDGSRSVEEVHKEIIGYVKNILKEYS